MKILLLLLLTPVVLALEPRLACSSCNATVQELDKLVQKHKSRAGNFENALSEALEHICADGHAHFSTYAQPPLVLKRACPQLIEAWDEKITIIKRGWRKAFAILCEPLCEDAEDSPAPGLAGDLIRINNKPLEISRHSDGHYDAKDVHEL
jgi:hypothetical protein